MQSAAGYALLSVRAKTSDALLRKRRDLVPRNDFVEVDAGEDETAFVRPAVKHEPDAADGHGRNGLPFSRSSM